MSNSDTNSPSITSAAPPPVVSPPALVHPDPLSAPDLEAYDSLRRESAWFESDVRWSSFRGSKAAEALNGLVTNDVSLLQPGESMHAAALTPKGKMLCDMLIVRTDESTFLLTMMSTCAPQWLATARKYVNPRLAKVEDESDRWATWMLYGADASKAVALLGGAEHPVEDLGDVAVQQLAEWKLWQHGLWNIGPASVRLIRAPLIGNTPGFIIMADSRDEEHVRERLVKSASRQASPAVWNVARVESGRPAWGVDMDENTIPQEANLDSLGAVSFTKGCYTGQETVARVHFRGHVNRRLRGLLGSSPLPRHASVLDAAGKVVGDVRSTVVSPRLGPIAIAMIRREVVEGDTVIVDGADGPITAEVRELPFPE